MRRIVTWSLFALIDRRGHVPQAAGAAGARFGTPAHVKEVVIMVRVFFALVALCFTVTIGAQGSWPTLHVTPSDDGFHTYVTAALLKKKVPVTVVTKADGAQYILTASEVTVEEVSTGSKVVKCLFASCAGTENKASTSAQLTEGDAVVWSYAVNKGRGAKNLQSMAESIAEHLKDDYLKKLK